MTLQAKGFQWSMAIHGVLLLLFAVLQVFAASQHQATVIDFTFSGNGDSSTVEPPSPPRTPAAGREPKRTGAVRPKEIAAPKNAKNPDAEEAPASPSPASRSGDVTPASESRADDGPGPPSALGTAATTSPPPAAGGSGASSAKREGPHAGNADGRAPGTAETAGRAAPGATPETARAAYLKEHFVYIRDRITGSIAYPHLARKMGWCGQVTIAFVVCEDGGVNDVKVLESSGFGLLDRNAVDTVKNVAPFPTPPVRAEIRMAITYRLN
jgi:protein TonB